MTESPMVANLNAALARRLKAHTNIERAEADNEIRRIFLENDPRLARFDSKYAQAGRDE